MLIAKGHQKEGATTIFCLTALILISLTANIAIAENKLQTYNGEDPCIYIEDLTFNSTKANESITWQTGLGPRLPGSNASQILRNSITENLTGFSFEESKHQRENFTLTNLFGTYSPVNSTGQNIVFVAHYDSRYMAERDDNESMRDQPIDGANDGASGVAVLIELGKIIPQMNLSHDVTLFFSDAEDQGERGYAQTWSYGARAWVENLTENYLTNISAYIVIDMIGDRYLDFTKIYDTSEELWATIIPLTAALGMMENELDCNNEFGTPIFNPNISRGVIDDHVPAHNAGIPAINFIDINFGENASDFGGHWHTHNDTADKVSAESLGLIGTLLQLGLLTQSWSLVTVENLVENTLSENYQNNSLESNNDIENEELVPEKSKFIGYLSITIVAVILLLILIGDVSLKL